MDQGKSSDSVGTSSTSNNTSKEKKYVFYRKPSLKKKGPEVKQTRTSMKRLLIANPLLKYEKEGIELAQLEKVIANGLETAPLEKSLQKSATSNKENKFKDPKVPPVHPRQRINSILAGNSCDNGSSGINRLSTSKQSIVDFSVSTQKILSSTLREGKPPLVQNKRLAKVEQDKKRDAKIKETKPFRRSISAQHFSRKNSMLKADQEKRLVKPKFTRSTDSLNNFIDVQSDTPRHEISAIAEGSRESSFVFKTPNAHERRSRISTPLSTASSRRSMYHPSTALPSLTDLQKRLNDWLVKRGKNISSFNNLKSFEPLESVDDENKENIEIFDRGSYEELLIPQNVQDPNRNAPLKDENIESIAKAALLDLLKLVREGFPVNQCDDWLRLIKEKYSKLLEEPEYWECRAAIEESRGDISSAVECYRTAIVHGAEVREVDKSLDVLLQKFSLLDINSEYVESEKITKERARIISDARNVFKSSIIKFAVQEKKLKKYGQSKLVAMPVRRSTRLSRSGYISTPGVKLCSSIRELDSPERSLVDFQQNKALD